METKRTPGPWIVSGLLGAPTAGGKPFPSEAVNADGGFGRATGPTCVARIVCPSIEHALECAANACLIAAAPDLEVACERMAQFLGVWRDGRGWPLTLAGKRMTKEEFTSNSGLVIARAALAKARGEAPL